MYKQDLTLNNPRGLICHKHNLPSYKLGKASKFVLWVPHGLYIYIYIYITDSHLCELASAHASEPFQEKTVASGNLVWFGFMAYQPL